MIVWLLNTLALMATAWIIPGLTMPGSFGGAMLTVAAIGLANALLRPLLSLLALPLTLLTLGLFQLAINAFCFWLGAEVFHTFAVDSFWSALFGWLGYSIISALLTGGRNQKDSARPSGAASSN